MEKQMRNTLRVATFNQHHYPGLRLFPLMALKVSRSSCKCETLNCAATLLTIIPLAPHWGKGDGL